MFAQAPQKMSYQAVIRSSSNALITTTTISMKISILKDVPTGIAWYVERHTPTTNANGLVSIEIGAGTALDGAFSDINWANGPYFIKTETDLTGGTNYTIVETNQLMSVPYALFSANASPDMGGFSHYIGEPYLGGIIYYLYRGNDGLEHGLVVALTETTTQWQTNPPYTVNANSLTDGFFNTELMTDSPAATYIATLGSGWFLPSLDELRFLYFNRYVVNKALFAGGNTTLTMDAYWCSSEYLLNSTAVARGYIFDFYYGSQDNDNKLQSNIVRGVKAF